MKLSNHAMPEKTIEHVSAACAELYQNAVANLQCHEPDSAIADLITALELEPGFLAARRMLRRAVVEKNDGRRPGVLAKLSLLPLLSKAALLSHVRPLKALSLAERVLLNDADNTEAHTIAAKSAMAAGYPRTALLSLEFLAKERPLSHRLQIDLAHALASSGETSDAAMRYGRMLKADPNDAAVLKELRKLSHRTTADAFQVTHARSQPANLPNAGLSPDEEIQRYEPIVSHCPKNTKVLLTLANAYAAKQLFDKAVNYYRRALAVEPSNLEIKKILNQTTLQRFDFELKHLNPDASDYSAQREKLQNERLEFERMAFGWPA